MGESITLLTPECIASYAQSLWAPSRVKVGGKETGDPRYGCELIFTPDQDISEINAAIQQAATSEFGEGILQNAPATFRWPMMKGEVYKPGDPTYEGKRILRVNRSADFGPPARVYNDGNYTPIQDQSRLYSGCIVQANVTFKAYNVSAQNQGVGAYINGVVLIREGEHLDGGQTAAQMFAGVKPGTSSAAAATAGQQAASGSAAPQAGNPWD